MQASSPPMNRPAARPETGPMAAAAVVVGALLASYAPNLANLARTWAGDPNYSHGFLVGPIALAILWQRRGALPRGRLRPSWIGWAALVAVLAARAWMYERNEIWGENLTLLAALAALAMAFGGWPLLRWAGPAVLFLLFMLPMPGRLNSTLAGPLQTLATIGSTALLKAMGLPVLSQGHIIFIGSEQLEVAQVCNGLSMLMAFVTLVTAATILLTADRPPWERILILFSAVPIALVANILRIAITAWIYHVLGGERGKQVAHDAMGLAMMVIGLVLMGIELKLLSWLVVAEEGEAEGPRLVNTIAPPPAGPAKKPG